MGGGGGDSFVLLRSYEQHLTDRMQEYMTLTIDLLTSKPIGVFFRPYDVKIQKFIAETQRLFKIPSGNDCVILYTDRMTSGRTYGPTSKQLATVRYITQQTLNRQVNKGQQKRSQGYTSQCKTKVVYYVRYSPL